MISAKEYTSAARVRMPLSRTSWETAVGCYSSPRHLKSELCVLGSQGLCRQQAQEGEYPPEASSWRCRGMSRSHANCCRHPGCVTARSRRSVRRRPAWQHADYSGAWSIIWTMQNTPCNASGECMDIPCRCSRGCLWSVTAALHCCSSSPCVYRTNNMSVKPCKLAQDVTLGLLQSAINAGARVLASAQTIWGV